jgi:hypothetical protein
MQSSASGLFPNSRQRERIGLGEAQEESEKATIIPIGIHKLLTRGVVPRSYPVSPALARGQVKAAGAARHTQNSGSELASIVTSPSASFDLDRSLIHQPVHPASVPTLLLHRKRPIFPSGMISGMSPTMWSWLM